MRITKPSKSFFWGIAGAVSSMCKKADTGITCVRCRGKLYGDEIGLYRIVRDCLDPIMFGAENYDKPVHANRHDAALSLTFYCSFG